MKSERGLVSPILEGNGSFPNETASVVPLAKPIEIFPGPQEIQKPTFKKTRLMCEVERVIQEDLQVFLPRKYSEDLSVPDISQMITEISGGNIKPTKSTIDIWLRKFNSRVRPRSEAIKLAWKNPEKRKRSIERIHSPTADRKRSQILRMRNWQSLSEAVDIPEEEIDEVIRLMTTAHQDTKRNMRLVVQETLTIREFKILKLRFGLGGDRQRTLQEVAHEFGVTRERIRQIQAKSVRRLATLNTA